MATLSLCMIVKNEEKNLPACLKTVKEAVDEIVIVDTGSTDRTVEIAKQFGARVYYFEWQNDFAAARNEAIKHATSDYIIWLDADERLNKIDFKRLLELKDKLPEEKDVAYVVEILNYRKGVLPEAGYQTRIFPNLKGIHFRGKIHEQVSFALEERGIKFEMSNVKIRHFGYFTPQLWEKKVERNLSLLEELLSSNPGAPNWDIHFYMGMCYLTLKEDFLAQLHFSNAFTDHCCQRNPYFYIVSGIELARIYKNEGKREMALKILLKLKEKFPENSFVLYSLAKHYLEENKYEEALAYFKQCSPHRLFLGMVPICKWDYVFDYYFSLGMCYEALGQEKEAIEAFKQALLVKPNNPSLIAHLSSLLLFSAARIKEAIWYLIKGINLMDKQKSWTTNKEVYIALCLMLAFILAKQCRIEECVFLAERLLKTMHLPTNKTLKGLNDLIEIFKEIGNTLRFEASIWTNLAFETAKQLDTFQQFST